MSIGFCKYNVVADTHTPVQIISTEKNSFSTTAHIIKLEFPSNNSSREIGIRYDVMRATTMTIGFLI